MDNDQTFLTENNNDKKQKNQEGTEVNDDVLDTLINDLYLPKMTDAAAAELEYKNRIKNTSN